MNTLTVKVKRYDPAKKNFFWESVKIPYEKGMSLLMALQYLYEEKDVHYRHSCDIGICTLCVVKVNGRNKLACKEILEQDEILLVEPFKRYGLIRDLVTILSER